jgi:hypothetical protein
MFIYSFSDPSHDRHGHPCLSHGFGKFLPRSEPHNLLCWELYVVPRTGVAAFPGLAIVVQALCHCRTTGVTPAVRHQLTIENSGHTPDPLFRLDLLAAQVALSTLSRRDHFVFQNAVVRRSKVTLKRSATKTVVLRKSANQ